MFCGFVIKILAPYLDWDFGVFNLIGKLKRMVQTYSDDVNETSELTFCEKVGFFCQFIVITLKQMR